MDITLRSVPGAHDATAYVVHGLNRQGYDVTVTPSDTSGMWLEVRGGTNEQHEELFWLYTRLHRETLEMENA